MWAVNKAIVLYQLQMPFEDDPIDLLQRLNEMTPVFGAKRAGLYNCLLFLLRVRKDDNRFLLIS